MSIFKKCYAVSLSLGVAGFFILCRMLLYVPAQPSAWLWFAGCGVIGIITAYLFVIITQYYTDYEYPMVQKI